MRIAQIKYNIIAYVPRVIKRYFYVGGGNGDGKATLEEIIVVSYKTKQTV